MERSIIHLQLRDKRAAQWLAASLPAYFPVAVSLDAAGPGAIVLTDDPAAQGRALLLPGSETRPRLGALLDQLARLLRQAPREAAFFGPFTLAPGDQALWRAGDAAPIRLTEKERDLLWRLFDADAAVDRDTLLTEIWGYAEGLETHTVETHIYRLRQKIEDNPAAPVWLLTDGAGYRLARAGDQRS